MLPSTNRFEILSSTIAIRPLWWRRQAQFAGFWRSRREVLRGVAVCGTDGARQVQGGSPSLATIRVLGVAPSMVSYDFDLVRTSVCLFSRVLSGGEFARD